MEGRVATLRAALERRKTAMPRTSAKLASKAAKVLRNPRSSKTAKSIAASDLENRKPDTPRRKGR